MLSWLPSIPYHTALPGEGYWLPVTSTLNWCEEDYYATIYSAEIVNTLTNLLFVYLALKGVLNCYYNGHDRIFLITFLGYGAVGIGSFLFHATLKYPMQLIDELSMIYTTCFTCYASFTHKRSPTYSLFFAIFLVSLALFITGYYHYLQDPEFHQIAFALLTATVLFRGFYVMEVNLRPTWRGRQGQKGIPERKSNGIVRSSSMNGDALSPGSEQTRKDTRDEDVLRNMWGMIAYGLGIFLGGFGIWTLDNVYCSTLRSWRRDIGLPWGIILEGHGWWHIMTGTGAYFYIVWGIWLRHCLNGKQDEYELKWPSLVFSLPVLVRRKEAGNVGSYSRTLKKDL